MKKEHRRYTRIPTDMTLTFSEESSSTEMSRYLKGVAQNLSVQGMFIETSSPLPKGSVLKLEFYPKSLQESEEQEKSFITVRAIVRWKRHFGKPRGMGVEFFEFENLRGRDFEDIIGRLFE